MAPEWEESFFVIYKSFVSDTYVKLQNQFSKRCPLCRGSSQTGQIMWWGYACVHMGRNSSLVDSVTLFSLCQLPPTSFPSNQRSVEQKAEEFNTLLISQRLVCSHTDKIPTAWVCWTGVLKIHSFDRSVRTRSFKLGGTTATVWLFLHLLNTQTSPCKRLGVLF